MSNVVRPVVDIPNRSVVDGLNRLLERARSGEILSFAAVLVNKGGETQNLFTTNYPVRLLGELRVLERDLIDEAVELRLHPPGYEY